MRINKLTDTGRRIPQPSVVIPQSIDIPMAAVKTLPNGARIYTIECPEKDVVRFSFVFRAGTSWQDAPFSASATVNMLAEGSRNMTAQQIAERLDYYGSYYDVTIDRDWSVATFVCLSKFFDQTLEVAREALLEPVFPEDEVRTYCDKSRQSLIINRTKMDFAARELMARSLYGADHPYGLSSDAAMYDRLHSEDLASFHRRHYTGRNCFVVMSGDTCDEKRDAVAGLAAELPAGENNSRAEFAERRSVPFASAPFPGVQSAVRMGKVLFPRSHPDFIGMQVVTTALGGYFGSRLMQNLRERHGYTYSVYSAMVNFDRSGYLAIATEVGRDATDDAVAQILKEIERLRSEKMDERELSLVKNIMIGEVMRILDGPFGIADVTIESIQNDTDNSYLNDFVKTVRGFTPEDVQALSEKYLAPDTLTTVIVGAETKSGKAAGDRSGNEQSGGSQSGNEQSGDYRPDNTQSVGGDV